MTDRQVSDRTFKILNVLHKGLVTVSFGRLGWTAAKMPVVELTTIGRKSGEKRTVMLTSPCKEGDAWVVVASRYGDTKHPDWFLNLQANPSVEIGVRGKKQAATARSPPTRNAPRCGPRSSSRTPTTPSTRRRPTGSSRWYFLTPA